uniref:Uncharacterized protein n=1 Tax=Helianthus annuus TaxID=4232 RepID=A0A251V9N4_HELAN
MVGMSRQQEVGGGNQRLSAAHQRTNRRHQGGRISILERRTKEKESHILQIRFFGLFAALICFVRSIIE